MTATQNDLQIGDIVTKRGWGDEDREVIVGTYEGYWVCVDVVDIDAAVGNAALDLYGDGTGEFPDLEPGEQSIRLRSMTNNDLIKWRQEWKIGDKVYHPTEFSTSTVLGITENYLWIQEEGDSPRTIHKNSPFAAGLVKAPF